MPQRLNDVVFLSAKIKYVRDIKVDFSGLCIVMSLSTIRGFAEKPWVVSSVGRAPGF